MQKNGNISAAARLSQLLGAIAAIIALYVVPAFAAASDIKLVGIFFRPEGRSQAIFAKPDGTQKLVAVGRMVTGEIEVLEITQNKVQLRGAAGPYWLSLASEISTPETQDRAAARAAPSQSAYNPKQEPDELVRAKQIKRGLLLGLTPYKEDGRTRGFAVRERAQLPALDQAGLRPGDVLRSANGNKLTRIEDIDDLSYDLGRPGVFRIEFDRDGKSQSVNITTN